MEELPTHIVQQKKFCKGMEWREVAKFNEEVNEEVFIEKSRPRDASLPKHTGRKNGTHAG